MSVFSVILLLKLASARYTTLLTSGTFGDYNIGESTFNSLFQTSTHHIIRRVCDGCTSTHEDIFYLRYTDLDTFEPYSYMSSNWFSNNNILGTDFNLFSNLADALNNNIANAWTYCDYDDSTVGFPRDCGPTGAVTCNWNSWERSDTTCQKYNVAFYLYDETDEPTANPTPEPTTVTLNPTPAVINCDQPYYESSCYDTTNPLVGKTLLCDGYRACEDSELIFDTAWCYGRQSCAKGTDGSITTTGYTRCRGDQSCVQTTINANPARCFGAESCFEADITSTSGNTECVGSYSCWKATIASTLDTDCSGLAGCQEATITSTRDLKCVSHGSCVSITATVNGNVDCSAPASCHSSTLTMNGDGTVYLYTRSFNSAHNAHVTYGGIGTLEIYSTGESEWSNAQIFSGVAKSLKIDFKGQQSASNVAISCGDQAVCNIECYGDGCTTSMRLYCSSQASWCHFGCSNANPGTCDASISKIQL